ncbi:MAG: hypothetical protein LBQ37_01015 [Elusimicrobiota bacterium]|jgi:hypothetical protein|nr:hypothetical protein [Elusimicrobiota bacterium]
MELKDAIKEVLDKIPPDCVFDPHTIINYLLTNDTWTEVYLRSFNTQTVENYHSTISKIIKSFPEVEDLGYESWSKNIHDEFSKCSCYKKRRV